MIPAILSGSLVATLLLLVTTLYKQTRTAQKLSNLRVTLATAEAERDRLRSALHRVEAELRRAALVAQRKDADHARRLRFYREQVEACSDPDLRGRIAVDALRELLSQDLDPIDPIDADGFAH